MSINYGELRSRLRIEDVLRWMSWEAGSRRGFQLRGRCPFCAASIDAISGVSKSGGHRTFSVNTERNLYRCFKCHQGGNALDLWRTYRGLPLYEAAQELEARLGPNTQPPDRT